MGLETRRASGPGLVSIAIDMRTQDTPNAHARWHNLADLLFLLELLRNLVGPECDIFADFGVLTIKDVSLADLRTRMEEAADG